MHGSTNHAIDAVGAGGGSIIGMTIAGAWPASGMVLVDRSPV
ncbi:putative membrane protein [Burkholderia cepacia]|nr:putative membrane protein [Burkholderia cepacia]